MDFHFEHEMTPMVEAWLASEGLETKAEFVTPWGICDLVGTRLAPERVTHRMELGQRLPIGSEVRISLLREIPDEETGRAVTRRKLARTMAGLLSEAQLDRELDELKRRRFVSAPRKGQLQRRNGWEPLEERLVAVELKLNRVSEVLSQARSHLSFADACYVALPYQAAVRVADSNQRRRFEGYGVGLVAVRGTGCEVLINPRVSVEPKDATLRMHCVERFWRTRTTALRRA